MDRVGLAHLPTPLEPMDRFGRALGFDAGALWVKRDDCTGLAGGGNKARKLEFICADALARGSNTLVTGGGPQSNHVRMTAAAANKLGLGCVAVLAGSPGGQATGNILLDQLMGAEIEWAGDDLDYYGLEAAIEDAAGRVRAAGRAPYAIPVGGASCLGVVGYLAATDELLQQDPDIEVAVVADGSGGTHAGLVAGFGDHSRVLGVDVGTRPDLDEQVPVLAAAAAQAAGRPEPTGTCHVDHDRIGPGYGAPTAAAREALDLAARLEGLVLDPVYSGKAMAGLMAARREGRLRPDQKVVFFHTGGMPALFSGRYGEWIGDRP
jgi:D-cysteine desulfhydrase